MLSLLTTSFSVYVKCQGRASSYEIWHQGLHRCSLMLPTEVCSQLTDSSEHSGADQAEQLHRREYEMFANSGWCWTAFPLSTGAFVIVTNHPEFDLGLMRGKFYPRSLHPDETNFNNKNNIYPFTLASRRPALPTALPQHRLVLTETILQTFVKIVSVMCVDCE